jgi:hypothetical protein
MSIESRDMEIGDARGPRSPPGVNARAPFPDGAQPPIAQRPFSTTLEQASRPTPPPADPPPVPLQLDAPKKGAHGTTLPEGAFPSSALGDLEEVRRVWRAREAAKERAKGDGGPLEGLKKTAPASSDPFAGLDGARTPSATERARPKGEPPIAENAPVSVDADAMPGEETKPRSKISTQRFVPPTTRRPGEDEVYPPILPSEEDDA